jgi:hypothetical protein
MRIGFIGLGVMGSRMAANLQKCGHSLVIHDRTRQKAEPLLAKGAEWADTPADLPPTSRLSFQLCYLAFPTLTAETGPPVSNFITRVQVVVVGSILNDACTGTTWKGRVVSRPKTAGLHCVQQDSHRWVNECRRSA